MTGRGRAGVAGSLLAVASLAGGLAAAAPTALAAGSPAGTITALAGGPGRGLATKVYQSPIGVATSPGGEVYVAAGTVVREFGITKPYEDIAAGIGISGYSRNGGPASSSRLGDAEWVAVGAAGNLVINDWKNDRVRVVAATTGTFYGQAMTAGDIYTIAGNGTAGYSGDGAPATSAELLGPRGVAVDAAGNLLIADLYNDRVQLVSG